MDRSSALAQLTGFGGPTSGPIWRSYMESAVAGNCPEFPEPSSLPELSGLDSEHTSGSSGSSSSEYEYNEYEEEEETSEEPSKGKGENDEAAPEAESTPEAAPTPEGPASPPPSGGGISPG